MVNKHWRASLAMVALCHVSPGFADTPRHITVSDIDAIMQEEILTKAMAGLAKQRAELAKYPGSSGAHEPAAAAVGPLPQLSWRRATASGWLAKFVLPGGASMIAAVGETLPGGFFVESIDANGVKLRAGSETIELAASATPAVAANVSGHVH